MTSRKISSLTVYCGSSPGKKPVYQKAAEDLGSFLAKNKIKLIYGGGQRGLMGALADSCMKDGGRVMGIIPDFMVDLEWAHPDIQDLKIVSSMTARKELLLNEADAIMVLPGGIGTLEEFSEVLSWSQLGLHKKPIGFYNVEGFYDSFLTFLNHMIDEGFCPISSLDLILVDEDLPTLFSRMATFVHHGRKKIQD